VTRLPDPVAERVLGRIKYLARLKTYQDSLPQDGRIDKGDLQAQTDLRVSTYPTVTGEKIVLRLFHEVTVPTLQALGFPGELVGALGTFLRRSTGLLLLTGPAGSGKTTTIYACLQELATRGGRHVITVEDPVERIVPGVMQTEVSEARGLTYARAARHLLRQDPEVLVVGEIRDEETAQQVVRAALTGHLVISTLHAGSCRGVMDRLCMLCPERSGVVAAVEFLLNQRLLRRLCESCRGAGCPSCLQTGYHGRIAVAEGFQFAEAHRAAFHDQWSSVVRPSPTLAEAAQRLVRDGLTNLAEYERVLER
jgi:general secretion pathway protein E